MKRLYVYQRNVPRCNGFVSLTYNVRLSVKRAVVITTLLSLSLATAACGGPSINALRGIVAGFTPLVTLLVSQGKISADKAALYTSDANKLIDAFGVLTTEWNAAKDRLDKYEAARTFANTIAPIASDFGKVPQLATAMVILNTTISVLEAFYAPPGVAPRVAQIPRSEKDLDAYVKAQSAKLKVALEVK